MYGTTKVTFFLHMLPWDTNISNFASKSFCLRTKGLILNCLHHKLNSRKLAPGCSVYEIFYSGIISGDCHIPNTQNPVNPFVPNTPFLYPLKTSENRKVF